MDQASTDVRQTAAFARRLVCRTLTVVGGVAAGTALAWWLSTTVASAEIEAPVVAPGLTAVERVQEYTAPVTGQVEQAVTTITQYLQDPPQPPENSLGDLGEQVSQKVKDATQKFRDHGELPDCTVCAEDRQEHPADGYGRSALPTTAQLPALTPTRVALPATIDLDAIAHGTAKERALADGMSRRGSPEPAAPALPDLPAPLSPVSPQGVPAGGGHGSAGKSFDQQHVAVLPWRSRVTHLVVGGVSAVADAADNGRPGNQPGVAPD